MALEAHRAIRESPSVLESHPGSRMTAPSGSRDEGNWMACAPGSRSLAATGDAGRLEYRFIELVRDVYSQAAFQEMPLDFSLHEFPLLVDEIAFPATATDREEPDDERARSALLSRLRRAFDDTPLEDGYNHPAERALEAAIAQYGQMALNWIRDAVLHRAHHAFGASVLRCLGRLDEPIDSRWRSEIVQSALTSASAELRDAAVQAVENWEDDALLPVLERHEEPVRWLKEYIEQVVRDLSE